ncbi:MAG: gamma-glutamyltransferase [Alphaproteobacteria bacterium]
MYSHTDHRPPRGGADSGRIKGIARSGLRQRAPAVFLALVFLALALLAGVGACDPQRPAAGTTGYASGFAGAVVADEPRAALAARDILSTGGGAVDAAVALAFTMAVTNPSSAGLGGGGVCMVRDPKVPTVETLEFYATAPAQIAPGTPRPSAVPGLPRGLYALHAKYGKVRWEQLLASAETLARFGNTVSRSLAQDLTLITEPLLQDAEIRRVFADGTGRILQEGAPLAQIDLAATIGRIRLRGPGEFYLGQAARDLVAAVTAAGGSLSLEDLRDYAPRWIDTLQVPFGTNVAHFAPPPAGGGVAGQMWAMLVDGERYTRLADDDRHHLMAQVAMRAYADRTVWMKPDGTSSVPAPDLVTPARVTGLMASYNSERFVQVPHPNPAITENPAGTGFTVVDSRGLAVSCVLSMNNLFGIGRIAPGTGMVLAAAPHPGGRGPYALAPMMVVKRNVPEMIFAGTGTGGPPAASALVATAARTILGRRLLAEAVMAPRLHAGMTPDLVVVETAGQPQVTDGLGKRGYTLGVMGKFGRVNAVGCPDGLPPRPDTCEAVNDPRASGIGMIVNGG